MALLFTLSSLLAFTGCASLFNRSDSPGAADSAHPSEPRVSPEQQLTAKDQKILELETSNQTLLAKIENLEGKLRAAETRPDLRQNSVIRSAPRVGGEVIPSQSANDPQAGFAVDASVQTYRQAKALFDSEKFPESILGFSSFVERYPHHALAGLAQYYLADAYFLQGEYALSEQEYYQAIGKFSHSPMVSFAYQKLALAMRKQGKTREAAAAESQVEALFPRSPALEAVRAQQKTGVESPSAAIPETAPAATSPDPVPGENT